MRLLLLLLVLFIPHRHVVGVGIPMDNQEIKSYLEAKLEGLVKRYDKDAIAIIKIEKKKTKQQVDLPDLPFAVGLSSVSGSQKLSQAQIILITHDQNIEKRIKAKLDLLLAPYFEKYILKVEPIDPDGFGLLASEESSFTLGSFFAENQMIFTIGLSLIFLVVAGLMIKRFMDQKNHFKETVNTSLNNIATALNEGAFGSAGGASARSGSSYSQNSGASSLSRDSSFYSSLKNESLLAIFSDCYWCQEDEYAAFLWSVISLQQREELLRSKKLDRDYFVSLAEKPSQDKGFINDPYYLKPMDLDHLNNDDLTNLVKKGKLSFTALSKLRQTHLPLEASDKLSSIVSHSSKKISATETTKALKAAKPSTKRVIHSSHQFYFGTLEEERAVVMDVEKRDDAISSFISLSWLMAISEDQAKSILTQYNAKQLAQIWFIPEQFQDALFKLMPEQKASLIQSYLTKITPTRENELYKEIYLQILDAYQEQESTSKSSKKAA
jgi:hypothetical protein